jgi:hypothetical protein
LIFGFVRKTLLCLAHFSFRVARFYIKYMNLASSSDEQQNFFFLSWIVLRVEFE